MRITADTNVLLRVVIRDDAVQAEAARALLENATLIAIPVAVFCELAWVLGNGYRRPKPDIATAINGFLKVAHVSTDDHAVEAGLDMLAAGGDFADGAIAHQGRALGGEVFASFDKEARMLLERASFETVKPG